ncbi:hypothetical protein GOBAR_DD05009 [Gossypium barbadense]|nr:hypothetical protein GOBAR_DD05009 [Gossypium barbadense]
MSAEQKEQVPNPNVNDNDNLNSESKQEERQSSTRTPFTNLSQDGEDDNDASVELDPADFSSDEAYARALQDAEEREVAARLLALAGINDGGTVTLEDHGHGGNSQDTWEEVDPDELSYEELLALAEVVGTESRGLSADSIASLPSLIFKAGNSQTGTNDSCVICRVDYEDGDSLTALSCKHSYHPECINNWLKINKLVKPVQSTDYVRNINGRKTLRIAIRSMGMSKLIHELSYLSKLEGLLHEMVERSDLAALEFLMSKQPRGNVRVGVGNTVGARV